jgi:hypothetical protein
LGSATDDGKQGSGVRSYLREARNQSAMLVSALVSAFVLARYIDRSFDRFQDDDALYDMDYEDTPDYYDLPDMNYEDYYDLDFPLYEDDDQDGAYEDDYEIERFPRYSAARTGSKRKLTDLSKDDKKDDKKKPTKKVKKDQPKDQKPCAALGTHVYRIL